MKNLIIILSLLFSSVSNAQVRTSVYLVPDSTTAFLTFLPSGSLVYDLGAKRLWSLTASAGPTDDISTSSKGLIVSGEANEKQNVYNFDGTLQGNRTLQGGGNNLAFQNLGTFNITSNGGNSWLETGGNIDIINTTAAGSIAFNSVLGSFSANAGTSGFISAQNNLRMGSFGGSVTIQTPAGGVHVGSAANADVSAIMEITSTTKGFIPPRMTTGQRNSIISPKEGLIIFNTTNNRHQGYTGFFWRNL